MLAREDRGDGTPVVLLHGLTASRRYVVMGSRALERGGFRVVAYDARGHGESSPAELYDYPALCADLAGVLDEVGEAPAVLAGASMGAHTALRLALAAPDRVRALVLVTPAHDPGGWNDPGRLARWDALARGLREGGVEGFVDAYGEPEVPERWRETVRTVVRQRLSVHRHPGAVADALEQVPRSAPFERWEDLESVAVPTVVVGSRDEADPGHPLAVAEEWARRIPGARLEVEDPGEPPLAWQGGRLSKLIAAAAAATPVR